jgi:hypothetical protein
MTSSQAQSPVGPGERAPGHFLVDCDGIVRWSQTEAPDSPGEISKFPAPADLISAAGLLAGRREPGGLCPKGYGLTALGV